MNYFFFSFTLLFFISRTGVEAIHEIHNPRIVAAPLSTECASNRFTRPCPKGVPPGFIPEEDYPPDWSCPCIADGTLSGAIEGDGEPFLPNEDADGFVEYILADGFPNIIDVSFCDDIPIMFVATREGYIWRYNLETHSRSLWIDLSDEVGFAGDRGMMGIETHPQFSTNPFVFLLYTEDVVHGPPNDFMERAANQRLIRLEDSNGVVNPLSRIDLMGGSGNDGPPICFNTHAVGSVKFAHDGSLFVSTGEGAHWNFDDGDFGQDQDPWDFECAEKFGHEQDIGAFRSQSFKSLSGKILRIKPDTGEGICLGSGYATPNPFCDGDPNSIFSKIWALGARNPFRMTVRPFIPGDDGGFPGVVYFGDVGQGGYEEVNAVYKPGMNFGWPCWEGPFPCPMYRDSPLNRDWNVNNATYNGTRINCPYMYYNMTTDLPFFYWSRFRANAEGLEAGYFKEIAYLGQNLYGNTVAGLAFYTGDKYPPKYKNALFALEFSQWWISVLFGQGDQFISGEHFFPISAVEGGKVTLVTGPDGDICYLTMNGGEIRCFRYDPQNVAPIVSFKFTPSAGNAPITVQFSSDGTYDRENDPILLEWNFGDGSEVVFESNPVHTFTIPGIYNVSLTVTDVHGKYTTRNKIFVANHSPPQVSITSPTTSSVPYLYVPGEILTFEANVQDSNISSLNYRWEFSLNHNNHIHPGLLFDHRPTFSINVNEAGIQSHAESDRVNYRVILQVRNSGDLVAEDSIVMMAQNWEQQGNTPPIIEFTYNTGILPLQVRQPVIFDAKDTIDPDGDGIRFFWDFGDGFNLSTSSVTTSHLYQSSGDFIVTLKAYDIWETMNSLSKTIFVEPLQSIPPVCLPNPLEPQIEDFIIHCFSIEPGAQLYFTLDSVQEPTQDSTLYTNPLYINHVPYANVTLYIRSYVGNIPSEIKTYVYRMAPPACNILAFQTNDLVCVNSLTTLEPEFIQIIPRDSGSYTENPPDNPNLVVEKIKTGVNGFYDASQQATLLHLWVNAGESVGSNVRIRVSYDFTGDGTYDRFETFHFCSPNDVDDFELCAKTTPSTHFFSVQGSGYQNLENGIVRTEIWVALNPHSGNLSHPISIRVGNFSNEFSFITIPFTSLPNDNPPVPPSPTPSSPDSCGGIASGTCSVECFEAANPNHETGAGYLIYNPSCPDGFKCDPSNPGCRFCSTKLNDQGVFNDEQCPECIYDYYDVPLPPSCTLPPQTPSPTTLSPTPLSTTPPPSSTSAPTPSPTPTSTSLSPTPIPTTTSPTPSPSATLPPTTISPSPTTSNAPIEPGKTEDASNIGIIVGAAIGGFLFAICVAIIIGLFVLKKVKKMTMNKNENIDMEEKSASYSSEDLDYESNDEKEKDKYTLNK